MGKTSWPRAFKSLIPMKVVSRANLENSNAAIRITIVAVFNVESWKSLRDLRCFVNLQREWRHTDPFQTFAKARPRT